MRSKIIAAFAVLPLSLCLYAQQDSIPGVNSLLKLSLEQLMNIKVVTASGYLQSASEAPSTITVITAEQIAERGYEQLEDAMRDVPGIDMIHLNGYAPTLFYFRGMYGAENLRALLMIDGMPENNILGSNDLAGPAYSLHNVERIEIIWGPVSALYGANAYGGVINIISKKGGDIQGCAVQLGYGSYNTRFIRVNTGLKRSKWEFASSASVFSSDGPRYSNRDPQYSASFVDKAYSLMGALSYEGKKSKTTAGFRSYRTPMGWGNYANSPVNYLRLPPQGNGNLGIVGVMQRNIRGERSGLHSPFLRTWYLHNEFRPNIKWQINSRLYYRETGSGEDSYIYITLTNTRLYRFKVASYSNRVAGDVNANYFLSDKHHFAAGIEYNQDNVEEGARGANFDFTTVYLIDGRDSLYNLSSTFLPRKFDVRNNFGSYLQYVLHTNLAGKTNFTLGLRYDNNSYYGNSLNPRISIVNMPSKKLIFKFQFGSAFRAPTNLEIYQTPGGNFQIKTEKLRAYEINAIYSSSDKLRVQVNGFRNELDDVVVLSNLSGLTINKNPAEVRVMGVEGILDMVLTKNISGFMNFTYQEGRGKNLVTGASRRIPAIARVKGNVGVRALIGDLFTVNFAGNLVGKRKAQSTNPYGAFVKGYFLGNLTLTSNKLFNDRITVSFSVRNMFDAKWLDPGFRTADGLLYSTVLEQPGINGLLKLGIDF